MATDGVQQNQEIDLVKRDVNGVIVQHKRVIFKDGQKTELDLEV